MSGVITQLAYQKKRKNRVNIFLDGAYAFSLPDVLAASLSIGQHLEDEEIAQLQARDQRQRAMDKALRLLARRPRSSHEVNESLQQAGYSAAIRQQVISRLQEMEYLDDMEFARWWVQNRVQFNPRSTRALQQELRQKGIAPQTITTVLALLDDDALAIAAAEQRAYRWQHLSQEDFFKKMLAYLQRRGFSYASARQAAEQLWRQEQLQSADYDKD